MIENAILYCLQTNIPRLKSPANLSETSSSRQYSNKAKWCSAQEDFFFFFYKENEQTTRKNQTTRLHQIHIYCHVSHTVMNETEQVEEYNAVTDLQRCAQK